MKKKSWWKQGPWALRDVFALLVGVCIAVSLVFGWFAQPEISTALFLGAIGLLLVVATLPEK